MKSTISANESGNFYRQFYYVFVELDMGVF